MKQDWTGQSVIYAILSWFLGFHNYRLYWNCPCMVSSHQQRSHHFSSRLYQAQITMIINLVSRHRVSSLMPYPLSHVLSFGSVKTEVVWNIKSKAMPWNMKHSSVHGFVLGYSNMNCCNTQRLNVFYVHVDLCGLINDGEVAYSLLWLSTIISCHKCVL